MRGLRPVLFACCLLQTAAAAFAQTGENVLVVINENSPASITVGEYYAKARNIAADQVVRIRTSTEETVSPADYARTIEAPVADWLAAKSLQDRILYIVLTKGVPIRIRGTGGLNGTVASVDSELTLLYRKLLGITITQPGRLENPYFLGDKPIADAGRFTRVAFDIYLVTRLDGYTVEDVQRLIDRGLSPARDGKFVLDQRSQLLERTGGDRWLSEAATRLESGGAAGQVVFEATRAPASVEGPVLGYYSWGSNDQSNRRRGAGVTFAPGALAGMYVSTDGRTFREPPPDWLPGPSKKPPSLFGSGSQSLAADLIREGATGVSAHVDEPYLDATVRPQVLLPSYLAGFNLAESFYLAMPFLSWRTMVIGDPLCAPFRVAPVPAEQIAKGIDPETELPALFAERRLDVMAKSGLSRPALQLMLKGGVLSAREDKAGAETVLRKARDMEPNLLLASLQLASLYELRGDYDLAIAEYRHVIAAKPQHPIALNNLAYALAVHKQKPAEALPFAEQAFSLVREATIADTLGWVHFLLGNHAAAAPLLEQAAAAVPGNSEIQLHAAFAQAAIGQNAKARAALDAAVKLDAKLADRNDIKDLRRRIEAK